MSVILAVSLFVSMRVTEASIAKSFEKSIGALSGRAEAIVTSGVGIEQEALEKIEKIKGVIAAPVINNSTTAVDFNLTMLVLGIDFIRDSKLRDYRVDERIQLDIASLVTNPYSIIIARSFANSKGLTIGSELKLTTRKENKTFNVAGIIDDRGPAQALGGQIIVMNILTAQELYGHNGRYNRIEVRFEGITPQEFQKELGKDYSVEPVPKTIPVFEYTVMQLKFILFGVTIVAMLIGIFIVYNSLSLSVVERSKEMGILRAIGAKKGEIVGALLFEALFVGFIASACGIGLGLLFSKNMVEQSSRTINLLMYVVNVNEVEIPFDAMVISLIVGVVTSIFGALFPALATAKVPPMVAIRRVTFGAALSKSFRGAFLLGAICLGVALFLSIYPKLGRNSVTLALVLGFCGLALMAPLVIIWFSNLFRFAARNILRIEGYLAVDNVVKFPSRTALTVIAFAGSLSMIVSISGTLAGFESSITRWLDSIFPFDVTLSPSDISKTAYANAAFPQSLLDKIEKHPKVKLAYGVRAQSGVWDKGNVMLVAVDMERFMNLRIERGLLTDVELAKRIVAGTKAGHIVVSTNFANLNGIKEGDEINIVTTKGKRAFKVITDVEDYSWPKGVIHFDRSVYRELWNDNYLTYIDVKLKDGVDISSARVELQNQLKADYNVFIYDAKETKHHLVNLVREWFRLADAQILISIIIGAIGVVNTLLISLITQIRQIALLRAIGASVRQINRSLCIEAVYIGILSSLLGCAMGIFMAKFPMSNMALMESGYSIPFVFPVNAVVIAMCAGPLISILSSLIPIRFTNKINITESIGYE